MNPYLAELSEYFKMRRVHAKLNRERLNAFAAEAALQDLAAPEWREPVYPKDDLEFVEFLGWSNSINFHFTDIATGEKFQTLWPECKHCRQQKELYQQVDKYTWRCLLHDVEVKVWGGAFAMDACLRRATEDGIPVFDPRFLRNWREWTDTLARFVFRGLHPVPVIPMLKERHKLLNQSAVRLGDYGEEWMNVFRMASFYAFKGGLGAVERLANEFPSYKDEYRGYPGSSGPPIPFHKRAHLFVQMYEGRARASSVLPRIKDPELLMLPADYELPRALRAIGAVEYSPKLLAKIIAKKEIKEGSVAEIEIRLAVVEAGEILESEINAIRKANGLSSYTKVEIDYLLWTKGRACPEPHHLTRTTKY